MVRIYTYNDLRGYSTRLHNVKSNLCTYFYKDKNKFCGNYVSRKPPHGHLMNKRCWRHKHPTHSKLLPPVVLLMISASERTYNRDLWIKFICKCEERRVPLELVIYHEDMNNCTVREPHNLLSRFRPFPDIFGQVIPLRDLHGSVNFTHAYLKMLEYGCKVPHAARCIVLTERTIPIRSPISVYNRAMTSKCHLDVSYNVAYSRIPNGLPRGPRGRPFAGVNNQCQGLFTTEFLKIALPCVQNYCHYFGLTMGNNGVYNITNVELFEQWRAFTGANPSEFLLLNSFLLAQQNEHPIRLLKSYMENSPDSDRYTVAFVAEWRNKIKRTFVFRSFNKVYSIPKFDRHEETYYRGLDFRSGVTLMDIIRYLRKNKKRALFVRQVETP